MDGIVNTNILINLYAFVLIVHIYRSLAITFDFGKKMRAGFDLRLVAYHYILLTMAISIILSLMYIIDLEIFHIAFMAVEIHPIVQVFFFGPLFAFFLVISRVYAHLLIENIRLKMLYRDYQRLISKANEIRKDEYLKYVTAAKEKRNRLNSLKS